MKINQNPKVDIFLGPIVPSTPQMLPTKVYKPSTTTILPLLRLQVLW